MSVHLGLKNGRMGLWTAPAGQDASSEGDRMTLNSDYDHLQFHATGQIYQQGQNTGNAYWNFPPVTWNFPDLGEGAVPLAFVTVSGNYGNRSLKYPPVLHNGSSDYDNYRFLPYEIGRNYIYMDWRYVWYSEAVFSFYVFKNRIM